MNRGVMLRLAIIGTTTLLLVGCGRQPPIANSFRQSALDSSGLVLQVHNTAANHLSCAIYAQNRTLGQNMSHAFDLAPYATTEIGLLETGWTFKTGERIRIATEGYKDITLSVP